MGLLANHLQKTGLWSIVHVTSMSALLSNPVPRSAPILAWLPWLVKIVVHFLAMEFVWMEKRRYRVGVRCSGHPVLAEHSHPLRSWPSTMLNGSAWDRHEGGNRREFCSE